MKDLWATLKDVITRLDEGQIPYMLVGSLASSSYGDPRLTRDLDLVVELQATDAPRIEILFPETLFYVPPLQVLSDEIQGRRQFNLIHHTSGLKIDLMIRKESPHAKAEFLRRERASLAPDLTTWIASAEDVIIKKLEYFREGQSEKHLRDIRGILAQRSIDQSYLDHWVLILGLGSEWVRAKNL